MILLRVSIVKFFIEKRYCLFVGFLVCCLSGSLDFSFIGIWGGIFLILLWGWGGIFLVLLWEWGMIFLVLFSGWGGIFLVLLWG